VVRYQTKDFRQRRPDGNGGYIWSLGDTRRVLYRLPEVLSADEVVIVEGEKDADRLCKAGFVATTSPQGAQFWRDELAVSLAGRRVAVIPDNDEAGRKHAQVVAAAARKHGAASVKLLDLGVQKKGGDASDWLDAGHTADELRDLIAKAPEWQPPASWRNALVLDRDRNPRGNEANVALILRRDPAFSTSLRFNEFTCEAECSTLPWRQNEEWRAWTDVDDIELAIWAQERGVPAKPATCAGAVQVAASKHPHHPVREYLDGLRWDGTKRLDTWLSIYLGVRFEKEDGSDEEAAAARAKNTYLREIGRSFLISAVARIYEPGCKVDHALIIEGEEGIGKSGAVKVLAVREEWFTDEIGEIGSKDCAQGLRGKWLAEFSDLNELKRAEIERTKSFISRTTDRYRPSYGRRSQDFKRQCAFAGTTNHDAYLQGETGNRRFWPAKASKIDFAALKRDLHELWAEAVAAYRRGEMWWLGTGTEKVARQEQAERRHVDVWEERVLSYAARQAGRFTAADVLQHELHIWPEHQDRGKEMRVSGILKANGWVRKRAPTGARVWGYVRKEVGTGDEDGPDDGPDGGSGAQGWDKGSGWDEVGTEKTQEFQRSSQPSQPSQPESNSFMGVRDDGRDDGTGDAFKRVGKRLGRWDGWDEPARGRDPNACIHCGKHCSPSDTANSVQKPDGRWAHLGCELAQP
jgi:predicted P-loop ATPase